MARIRTIKPEFWQDEKLAPLSPLTRLVFLGLIGMADDAGRLLDNVRVIDAFVFPETSETCLAALVELAQIGRIERGMTASGQRIIQITNWTRHQKIEKPNLAAAFPEIVSPTTVTPRRGGVGEASGRRRGSVGEASQNHTNDLRPTTNDQQLTTVSPPAAGWTALAGDAWRAERGRPNYGRIGKTLAPLVARYGAVQVLAAWRGYLDSRRGKSFASAEDFAANYLVHRDAHALAANDDGILAPIPDQPEVSVA